MERLAAQGAEDIDTSCDCLGGICHRIYSAFGMSERRFGGGNCPFDWYHIVGNNGPAWFLFALLYAKCLLCALRHLRLPKPVVGVMSLAIGYLGMNVNMPLLLDEGCAALPFYAVGKYAYPHIRKLLANKLLLLAGTIALLVCSCKVCSFTIVPQANGLYAPFYLGALLAVVLSFIPFIYLSGKLQGQKWLNRLGQHSLGIMLLHSPMCHTVAVVLNRVFTVGSALWIASFLVAYVAIVVLAYWLTIAIERYCPVLLGKYSRN